MVNHRFADAVVFYIVVVYTAVVVHTVVVNTVVVNIVVVNTVGFAGIVSAYVIKVSLRNLIIYYI